LTSEYETLEKVFDWNTAHFLTCNLAAIEHAFISQDKKSLLKDKILRGYK
jgi:adenosine deaminase